jgi:hypothetical protein
VQVPSELLVQRKSHVVLHLVALVLLDATAPNHASVLKKVDEARASLLPVNVQLHPPRPNVAVELPVASVQMDANVTAKPWIPVAKSRDRQVQLRLGPPKPVARVLKSVDVEMDVIVPAVARVAVVLKRNKRQSKTLSRIGSSIRVWSVVYSWINLVWIVGTWFVFRNADWETFMYGRFNERLF